MTKQDNNALSDDNLKGHDCGLINEKFNDKPIEPQQTGVGVDPVITKLQQGERAEENPPQSQSDN